MDKTDLMQDEGDNDPQASMTAEDIARYLLDALVLAPPASSLELEVKLKIAAAYTELAKAYIIADAIRTLAEKINTDRE